MRASFFRDSNPLFSSSLKRAEKGVVVESNDKKILNKWHVHWWPH